VFKYSVVINILCDIIADVVDIYMKTCPLTNDARAFIRALRVEKVWEVLRMMKEFPLRQWKRSTLNDLIERSPTNLLGADWSRRYRSC